MNEWGKYIIMIGIAIVAVGVVVYFLGDRMNWIGRLPGDIRIERENFKFYFPLTSLILLSAILNLILFFIKKFF